MSKKSSLRRSVLSLLALGLVAACAPASAPKAPPGGQARNEPAPAPVGKRAKLAALLGGIERPSDVLAGLSKPMRADLDAMLAQLGPKEREALAKNDGPFASERPLLHLAVGGSSSKAYYQLGATRRVTDEVMGVLQASGKSSPTELLSAVKALSRLAAERWLHDRKSELDGDAPLGVELLDDIDRAAMTLERRDVIRLERELAVEVAPDDADRWVSLARTAAIQLDVDTANRALAQARAHKKPGRMPALRLSRAERAVANAETVRTLSGKANDLASRLALARADLVVEREKDAVEVLEPERAAAASHLGLAGTLAIAELDGTICPGVTGWVANPTLCAYAWQSDPRTARAVELLSRAWKSGQGRDTEGLAAYLGLVEVVPWMYSLMAPKATSREELLRDVRARLAELQSSVLAASKDASTFEGLALFTDALGAGFDAASSDGNAEVPAATRKSLEQRAEALLAKSPSDPFTQGATLAVGAMLFRHDDVLPLIKRLPSELLQGNFTAYEVLRFWGGLAENDADVVRSATDELGALVPELAQDSLERPKIILLLAEGHAVFEKSDKAYGVLEQVARPLMDASVPMDLRLRATIDWAGASARAGKLAPAADALERLISNTSVAASSDAQTLGLVAASYLFVLRARLAKGSERSEYRDKLAKLAEEPIGQKAPTGVQLWREMWQNELDYLIAEEACGLLRPCIARAATKRGLTDKAVSDKVGAHAGKLLRAGSLPAGTLSVSFSYGGGSGLETVVSVEPQLLAVEVPATRSAQPTAMHKK